MEDKSNQIFDKSAFEGFEGAFGSESFQVQQDADVSALRAVGSVGATKDEADLMSSTRVQTSSATVSPALKHGYGVSSSILPTLSLSWFGTSGDKNPIEKKDTSTQPETIVAMPMIHNGAASVRQTPCLLSFNCV